jgi:IS1 family transposase
MPPARTPKSSTTNSWPFPPKTREVQFDEKWSFVGKKEKHCDPDDDDRGDCWDHVAYDPEHRLVVSAAVGRQSGEHTRLLVEDFHRRTRGRLMDLMTSDENPAYAEAIREVYGEEYQPRRRGRRGRRPQKRKRVPRGLRYATVHKTRENNRVVRVERRVIYGAVTAVVAALAASAVSDAVNTVFVERHHGTDRNRNARKARKSYCFSKDWGAHEAVSYFTLYSYNFCWPVRTLRVGSRRKGYRQRTPALAAGLTDHVWPMAEWLSFPAVQRR